MIEPAIVVVRLLQYAGAAILMGSPLFFVCAVPGPLPARLAGRVRRSVAAAAAVLALASLLAIAFQGSLFTGSLADGFAPDGFVLIVSSMSLGKAALVRTTLAVLALAALLLRGRKGLIAAGALGTAAAATLAWMGHAAAGDGWLPLAADILHALAASLWIGALAGFLLLLAETRESAELGRLQGALGRFSAIGVALVLALTLSGLANAWYVIGLDHLGQLPFTPYGRLLLAKLALFAGMLLLAALNRYRLTGALERGEPSALGALRRSLWLEAALGFAVLALVAWLGTLESFV